MWQRYPERRPREAIVWSISWNAFWSLCFSLSALHSSAHVPIHTTSLCSFFQNNHRSTTKKKIKSNKQKTDKTKKCQNKAKSSQKKKKPMEIILCWPLFLCVWPSFPRICLYIQWHSMIENWFFFANNFQLQIASWLGWDPMPTFPSQSCDSVCVGLVLAASLCEFINPVVSGRYSFIEVIYHLWLFQSFHLLFIDSLALRGVVGGKQSFNTTCFKFSHSLYIIQLWSLYYSFPAIARSFSDERWSVHWTMGMPVCHYGSFNFYFVLVE